MNSGDYFYFDEYRAQCHYSPAWDVRVGDIEVQADLYDGDGFDYEGEWEWVDERTFGTSRYLRLENEMAAAFHSAHQGDERGTA